MGPRSGLWHKYSIPRLSESKRTSTSEWTIKTNFGSKKSSQDRAEARRHCSVTLHMVEQYPNKSIQVSHVQSLGSVHHWKGASGCPAHEIVAGRRVAPSSCVFDSGNEVQKSALHPAPGSDERPQRAQNLQPQGRLGLR